jgi:hypothetical protein
VGGTGTDTQVPNPALGWLQTLLHEVQSAQSAIPLLDKPTGSIGPGPAWTGSKADSTHDHDLAPVAKPFAAALNALDGDVQAEINRLPKTVSSTVAHAMIMEHEYAR